MITTPAHAEVLSGQQFIAAVVGKKQSFDAGSTSQFFSDGTYKFAHANGTDAGKFKVAKNGRVTLRHGSGPGKGKTDVFVVDLTNGQYSVNYVKGRFKGQSYTFR